MGSTLFGFGFWLLATVAAGAAALGAVALAAGQVASSPVRPLTAAEVNALPVDELPDSHLFTPDLALAGDPLEETVGSSAHIDDPDFSTAATTRPATAPAPTTATTIGVLTTAVPTIGGTTVPTTVPTTSPNGEQQTFNLIGGSVSVILRDGSLELVWAVPNSGFQMDEYDIEPTELTVRFESETHKSELKVEWEDGVWDIETKEDDEEEEDDD